MIISLRGTNGSGKTWVARQFLERYPCEKWGEDDRGKPLGYIVTLTSGKTLGIVGSYENACGGCDGIQPYDNILPRVTTMAEICDHLLFEGALVSSGYGRIGVASEVYGNDFVFAFLDTPLDKCIQNVENRRKEKGNAKPLDPKNVKQKFRAVELSLINIRDRQNRRCVVIDHTRPISQILKLLQGQK